MGVDAYLFAGATLAFTVLGLAVLLPETVMHNSDQVPFMLLWFGVLGWFWFTVWLRVVPSDFFDLLTALRAINPNIEIKGV